MVTHVEFIHLSPPHFKFGNVTMWKKMSQAAGLPFHDWVRKFKEWESSFCGKEMMPDKIIPRILFTTRHQLEATKKLLHTNRREVCTHAYIHTNRREVCTHAYIRTNRREVCTHAYIHTNRREVCTYAYIHTKRRSVYTCLRTHQQEGKTKCHQGSILYFEVISGYFFLLSFIFWFIYIEYKLILKISKTLIFEKSRQLLVGQLLWHAPWHYASVHGHTGRSTWG